MTTTTRMRRLPAVMDMTGLGRDSIYRGAREGWFPRPRKLSEHCTAWREDEIREWIESRPVSKAASPNPRVVRSAPETPATPSERDPAKKPRSRITGARGAA